MIGAVLCCVWCNIIISEMPSEEVWGGWPVIRRRRSRIMCSPRVVGMSRPSSRDRFPRWNSMWWTCSHCWQEVVLASTAGTSGVEEVNVGSMVSKKVESGVDILMELQPEDQDTAAKKVRELHEYKVDSNWPLLYWCWCWNPSSGQLANPPCSKAWESFASGPFWNRCGSGRNICVCSNLPKSPELTYKNVDFILQENF